MKKSKKNQTNLIVSLFTALFGIVMFIPMVVPVMVGKRAGTEVGLFDITDAGNETLATFALIFVMVGIVALMLLAVCEILKCANIKIPRIIGMILSLVGIIATVVGFVFLICYVSDLNSSFDLFKLGVGAYLFLAFGIVAGLGGIISNKK